MQERLHAFGFVGPEFGGGTFQIFDRSTREKQLIPRIGELILGFELAAIGEVRIDDFFWQACRFRKTLCPFPAARWFERFQLAAEADVSRVRVNLHRGGAVVAHERHDARVIDIGIFDQFGNIFVPSTMRAHVFFQETIFFHVAHGAAVAKRNSLAVPIDRRKDKFGVAEPVEVFQRDVFELRAQ